MALYAATIFLSAFLLFLVQPLIGKYILPWFGGSPAVWTTCMLFFQVLLLAGYAFAHLINRLFRPRMQAIAYVAALLAAVAFLPITPGSEWKPLDPANPTGRILLLLLVALGMPYFLLSSTGSLIQAWFTRAYPGRSPYALYALSNLGSFVALLGYPILMEPNISRTQQAMLWSIGFVTFGLLAACVAIVTWRRAATNPAASLTLSPAHPLTPSSPLSFRRLALWILLPACGTTLLLAATNELTQDVAVVPFLWILPLALYLLSFIVCFSGDRAYSRPIVGLALAALLWPLYRLISQGPFADTLLQVTIYPAAMFVGCLICHGELYRLKPHPSRLTGFYLAIATGGAVGGVFVAIIAPALFDAFYELPIGILACALLLLWSTHEEQPSQLSAAGALLSRLLGQDATERGRLGATLDRLGRRLGIVIAATSAAFAYFAIQLRPGTGGIAADAKVVEASRNFYGLLGVHEHTQFDSFGGRQPASGTVLGRYVELKHGRIGHGVQFDHPTKRTWGTGYYGPNGGGGLVMRLFHKGQARRIGIVGLGIGTQATYGTLLDTIRFYEINPDVERLAREWFTYLSDSRANVEVVMGDARLSMEQELARGQPQQYDILVLDAFSGDAIPVHLLTREAFDVYLAHLKTGGCIAVHISNRHLDLRPVVWRLADAIGFHAVVVSNLHDNEHAVGPADWMLLTMDRAFLDQPEIQLMVRTGAGLEHGRDAGQESMLPGTQEPGRREDIAMWTDDRTSLLPLIRWRGEE